ncbi:MAG: 4Fe-4S binding protein [Helicobacteraceae bacterium]
MSTDTNKRSLFKIFGVKAPLRPPYFLEERANLCASCSGAPCVKACEQGVIKIQEGAPVLDFSANGCTFCTDCLEACELGVLDSSAGAAIKASITIQTAKCLSWNGVMCFSCKDPCAPDAIIFTNLFKPVVARSCTACGFCVSVCPAGAIKVGS